MKESRRGPLAPSRPWIGGEGVDPTRPVEP
jgi:hypothetical protein